MQIPRLVMLCATGLLIGCAPVLSERPCPRVTEFTKPVLTQAVLEIEGKPSISRMMDAMAGDRAFNRAICPN